MNASKDRNFELSQALENSLAEMAAHFEYPPTPDIVLAVDQGLVTQRKPVWDNKPIKLLAGAMAAFLLILVIVLAVPQVRAAVLDFLQIGAIGILVDEAPATDSLTPALPLPTLAGTTTLEKATEMVDFPILLPTYPASLGPPDQVFLQNVVDPGIEGQVLILVWLDPDDPGQAQLSLYQIGVPFYGIKVASLEILRETAVAGRPAYWIQGPHRLQLQDGEYQDWFFVAGNVLVWVDGEMTYRLESGLSLEEAIRIAESLEPENGS